MKRVNAGKYRERITLCRNTVVGETDDAGQVIQPEANRQGIVLWAEVKCISSDEVSRGQVRVREDRFEIRTRYFDCPVIDTRSVIDYDNRTLEITGARDVDGMGIEWLITATATGNPTPTGEWKWGQ